MRTSFATRHDRAPWAAPGLLRLVPLLAAVAGLSGSAGAQVVPGEGAQIGTVAADRARVLQINGLRADSARGRDEIRDGAARFRGVDPTVRLSWNSELPFEGNDGALWAGRGMNASVTGGVAYVGRAWSHPLDVVLAPIFTYSQNRPFPTRAGRGPGRSAFSSPWHFGGASADLPLRFGDLSLRTVGLGESAITVTTDRVAFGVASTSEWWGPAIRNTLLLSNNAAGIPRVFARLTRPISTRIGRFEGRAFVGALTESPYFDLDPANDHRSVNGVLVLYQPAIDSGLTLGLSRLVIAPTRSSATALLHPVDVLLRFDPIRRDADTTDTGRSTQGTDQLISLFARWVFPRSGFETYAEWARLEAPRTIGDFFGMPQDGYTIGLQWAPLPAGGRALRLQAEVSYLEQNAPLLTHPATDYYTGRAAVQGFTQQGQILGAVIGPGASSQYLGADWMAPRWHAGAFLGRTRTENDALYREGGPRLTEHDVTVYSGVRGGLRLPRSDVAATITVGQRYNYLFESLFYLADPVNAVDIRNTTITVVVSPR